MHLSSTRISTLGLTLASATTLVSTQPTDAQDYFPEPIERGPLAVGIEDFATLPNSGGPARASVMTRDPLGRIVVNDQRGPLYTISNDGQSVTPYVNINDFEGVDLQTNSGEQGFQSFAFHPDFVDAGAEGFGRFYTLSTSSNTTPTPDFDPGGGTAGHTVLYEWAVDDPTAATYADGGGAAPREVARFKQPFGNHNGGLISFNTTASPTSDDRGNLYVALGDGGAGNDPQENAQDTSNPYGSILRIDPTGSDSVNGQYGIVQDNALASDDDDDTLGEIYAFGLRNPQRFGWDVANGNMFIADIGQNAVEEVDLGANGANFGWDEREGSFENPAFGDGSDSPAFTDPVAEYDHTNTATGNLVTGSRAVTLGEVARGTGVPGLDGQLLLGDFPSGVIFTLDVDNDPLDGGQDGLSELILVDLEGEGEEVRLIDLINRTRNANGLGDAGRADLRFSLGTEGQVFVTNKQDGVIRQLTLVPEPTTAAVLALGALTMTLRRRSR